MLELKGDRLALTAMWCRMPWWIIRCLRKFTHDVIPGCALGRRPGIHNPRSWLWIPGSRFARPGMTVGLFRLRRRVHRVDPQHGLRLFHRLDVEIDRHGLAVAAHQHAF